MSLVGIDFETRSEVDLKKHGRTKYLAGRDADIICMAYKIDDQPTELWKPGDKLPGFMAEDNKFYAYNAQFDIAVWNTLGPKYKFPLVQISCWTDVMALCGRFTYHQSLEKAGEDLELKVKKNPRGKALIKKISCPPFEYTHQELMEFHEYCKRDVDTMYEMVQALPASKLSEDEQKIWELTVKINNNGLPVDVEAAKVIYNLTETYKEQMNQLLPELTGGAITKATQSVRITKWLQEQGVKTSNLQAATVEKLLKRLDLPDNAKTVLQLRQELGRSSTAKYLKIMDQAHKGRIYDNLRYYGAGKTGRWGGLGFQLHNLPRSDVKDAQPIIDKFYDLSIIEDNPVNAAKSIIRGIICAPKGKLLCFADYTGIENRGLAWVADDEDTLNLFRKDLDQYIDMAAFLFKKPYDSITDEERYEGKQLVLGCGYGLGWEGYMERAECSPEVAMEGVGAWRMRYYKVVNYWYACAYCAKHAIMYPGISFGTGIVKCHRNKVNIEVDTKCQFKVVKDRNGTPWLQLTLPSGRNQYYNKPELVEDRFGLVCSSMGINPYTKKWQRLKIIPGRFVENIVQALSRDVLAKGKLNLDKAGYKIIGSIHDEVILEVDGGFPIQDVYNRMCSMPAWADGLPLGVEGVIEKRYRKM